MMLFLALMTAAAPLQEEGAPLPPKEFSENLSPRHAKLFSLMTEEQKAETLKAAEDPQLTADAAVEKTVKDYLSAPKA